MKLCSSRRRTAPPRLRHGGGRTWKRCYLRQGRRAHLPGALHAVPSRRHGHADVAHDVRGRAAVGEVDPPASGSPRDATVASGQTVGIRKYKNDISLSDDQIATITRWVDAGAPAGPSGGDAARAEVRPRGRLAYRQTGSHRQDGPVHTMYPGRSGTGGSDYFADVPITEDRWTQGDGSSPRQSQNCPPRRDVRDRARRASWNA